MLVAGPWLADSTSLVRESYEGWAVLPCYTARYVKVGLGPPVILVHGLAGGVGLLTPLMNELAAFCRTIAYHSRGEDDPFMVRRPFDLDDLAGDLADFADHLGLERPIVVGVSLGAVVALKCAARFPFRFQALIVEGVDVRFEKTLLRQIASYVLRGYPLPTNSPFINQFVNLLFGSRPRDETLFRFVVRECWRTDQSVMAHRFRLAERFDLRAELSRVQVPVTVVHGRRDVLVSRKGLQALLHGLPEARLIELPDAGHLAFVTHAASMADIVRRTVEEFC